jgi:DNA-binding beta-propeller fold protein YncE
VKWLPTFFITGCAGDGTVSVIDGEIDAVVVTTAVGSHPYSIAVNSVTGKAYISHSFSDQLTILDCASNAVTHLNAGSSDLIAVDSSTNIVYLLGYESLTLKVFDGAGQSFRSIPIGMHQWGLALDEDSGTMRNHAKICRRLRYFRQTPRPEYRYQLSIERRRGL